MEDSRGTVLVAVQLCAFGAKAGLWGVDAPVVDGGADAGGGTSASGSTSRADDAVVPAPTKLQLALGDLTVYDGVTQPGTVFKVVSRTKTSSDVLSSVARLFKTKTETKSPTAGGASGRRTQF